MKKENLSKAIETCKDIDYISNLLGYIEESEGLGCRKDRRIRVAIKAEGDTFYNAYHDAMFAQEIPAHLKEKYEREKEKLQKELESL